jgi:parvulin-like peptidyl-prolyl isomerase
MTRVLAQQFKGEDLAREVEKMKKELLDRLIDQKVILSFAKEKNYDISGDIEMIIKNIKQENDLKTDEDLQRAIASQGIDFQTWKKQLTENRIQQRYIYQEIGSRINVDNSRIMEFYRANMKDFTKPAVFTLNCIFLDKVNYEDAGKLSAKKTAIEEELKQGKFVETAKTHSELPGETSHVLGEYKEGELDKKIEAAAKKLKEGQHSSWVDTENGWYIIHLAKYTGPQLVEYKDVRAQIENQIRNQEQDVKLKDFLVDLKKQSHIKVYRK